MSKAATKLPRKDCHAAHVDDSDLWQLLIRTVRYSMGRRSAAPSTTCAMVRRYGRHLLAEQRAQIAREVREELARAVADGALLGDRCDHVEWERLVADLDPAGSAPPKPGRVELVPFGKPDPRDDRTRGMLVVLVDGIPVGDLQRDPEGGYIFVDGPTGTMYGARKVDGGSVLVHEGAYETIPSRREALRLLATFVVREDHRREAGAASRAKKARPAASKGGAR